MPYGAALDRTSLCSILCPPVIFAYIDPNAGSLLIQAAIAMLVAVPFFFRRQLARAAKVIRPVKEQDRDNPG